MTFGQSKRLGVRWRWLMALLGAGLFFAWAWLAAWPSPIIDSDIRQERANTALPAPQENNLIRQTFVPSKNGMTEIELLLARSNEPDNGSVFELELLDEDGNRVVAQSLETVHLAHNQPFTLAFPPESDSAGSPYTLLIRGTEDNQVTVWGYDLDVYSDGSLDVVGQESTAQDLRFLTRYQLTLAAAVKTLSGLLLPNVALLLLTLAFVLMPGCLALLSGWRWTAGWDLAAWWGVALATGLSVWAILWLWLTLIGVHWNGSLLWAVTIVGWILTAALYLTRVRQLAALPRTRLLSGFNSFTQDTGGASRRLASRSRFHWQHGVLFLLLLLGLAVRILAIRDLAFPPWVDSVRHALITTIMAENGQTLQSYEPLLPVERALYHYGFHALSASLLQMTGLPVSRLLLLLGQLLNALVALAIYASAYLFTRRRTVSLLAGFLVSLPFFFPGYYATWGRMSQLAAMLIIPVAIGLTWRLVRGARGWQHSWWLLGILVAGLFLVHFRIFLLYLPFAALVWGLTLGRHGRWLALAAALALLLSGPRIIQLAADLQSVSPFYEIPGYNDFPSGYVTTGWERIFLGLAVVSILLFVLAGIRLRRWAPLPLILVAWVGIVGLFLSGRRLGLPETWLINLNSAYISLFLPLALLLAVTADWLWRWLGRRHWSATAVASAFAGAAIAAALLFGANQQVSILNPQTILARPQDLDGLAWLEQNVSSSAKVAASSWLWLGNTWAGSDGGSWILPLTGLNSTVPPPDYAYDESFLKAINSFNESASTTEQWSTPETAEWLRQQGVTHLFVGARGGFLDPAALSSNVELTKIYDRDGVFIFALQQS